MISSEALPVIAFNIFYTKWSTAFFIMVVIALDRIAKHTTGVPKPQDVKPVNFNKIPDFIGTTISDIAHYPWLGCYIQPELIYLC